MTMWECMKVTAIGDIGWAITFFGIWLVWKLFFASINQLKG